MRRLLVGSALALTMLTVAACGDDSSDSSSTEATTGSSVPDVVGQSVDEATATLEAAGYTLRVVKKDGEDLAATADYVENRVNVAVETQSDGTEKVTEVVSTG